MRLSLGERGSIQRRSAFTLMEIVLAIALTSVVMYLLATAIELFMLRVESSRGRVESAQIARTLLDQMAADLAATRLFAPRSSGAGASDAGSSGTETSGSSITGSGADSTAAGNGGAAPPPPSGSSSGAAAAPEDLLTVSDVHGIYGTAAALRIDRAATASWQRATREIDPQEGTALADMPLTVRYFVQDGDRLTASRLAQRGVSDEKRPVDAAGLYRASAPTASLVDGGDAIDSSTSEDDVRLLAPEVVKLELQYYDGVDFLDSWDTFDSAALPAGVEITLTLYEPQLSDSGEDEPADRFAAGRYRTNELVEYRRFVRIPTINPQQPAEALLPAEGDQGGGSNAPSGQGGSPGAGAGSGDGPSANEGADANSSN